MKLLVILFLISSSATGQTKEGIKKAMRDKTKKYTVKLSSSKSKSKTAISTTNIKYWQVAHGINASMVGNTITIYRK